MVDLQIGGIYVRFENSVVIDRRGFAGKAFVVEVNPMMKVVRCCDGHR